VLGLSGRRPIAPARVPWRDRAVAKFETPMPAAHPLQFGRAYQLPPFGRGNGLDALFWAPSARLPADRVDDVLTALAAEDIAAWVAPVRTPEAARRAADRPQDLWIAAAQSDRGTDVLMRVLAGR
jgi:hypothetical protein